MVAAFVDGFRDAMLWSAWAFGVSCGLAIVVALCLVLNIGGDMAKFLWNRRAARPTTHGTGEGE